MKESSDKSVMGPLWKAFGGGMIVIIALMVAYHFLLFLMFGESYERRAQFGDQFGAIGVVLSAAAFLGLVISILFQSRDLKAQTEALNLQQVALNQQIDEFKAQKDELERSAKAQEEYNKLTKMMLFLEIRKVKFELLLKAVDAEPTPSQRIHSHKMAETFVRKFVGEFDEKMKQEGLFEDDLSPEST